MKINEKINTEKLRNTPIKEPDTVFVPLFGEALKRAISLRKQIRERHYKDSDGYPHCAFYVEVPIDVIIENAYCEL